MYLLSCMKVLTCGSSLIIGDICCIKFPLHIEDLTCARQVVLLTGANAVVHEVVARSFWEVRDSWPGMATKIDSWPEILWMKIHNYKVTTR